MSRTTSILIASVFAVGAIAGTPAWADRGGAHFDRGNGHFNRGNGHFDHGYPARQFPQPAQGHRERRHDALGWGLGLLAGTAILFAATESRVAPRPVTLYQPPVIYTPRVVYAAAAAPPTAYSEPAASWWYYCAPAGAYYPYVRQCPAEWSRVPAIPPG